MQRRAGLSFLAAFCALLAGPAVDLRSAAPAPAGPAAATRPAWPQFHGARRDNVAREARLLTTWPAAGPPLLWRFGECGRGYSSVAVTPDAVYTAGDFEAQEFVLALTPDGALRWKSANGKSWRGASPGSRATPTVAGGRVFHMNPHGRVAALQAADGKEVWAVDLAGQVGVRHGIWALAESIVADGDRVLCLPGGAKGLMVALEQATGRTAWVCKELDDTAAYASPIVVTHCDTRLAITLSRKHLIGVDVRTGRLLWSHPHPTPYGQSANTPVVRDGHVFITGGHGRGGLLLRMNGDGRSVTEVWHRKDLDNCNGAVGLVDGRLYGSACRVGGRKFFCVDFGTGKDIGRVPDLGKVSLTLADGRLYCVSDAGRLTLLEPTADGGRIAGRFSLPPGDRDQIFAHPVVCDGRLYVRRGAELFAYDVRE